MRAAVLICCFMAGSIKVYPENPVSSASRTTKMVTGVDSRNEPAFVTEQQVYNWLQRWQQRLDLQDWKLTAQIVRHWELPKGTIANIEWSLSKRRATVRVLHSADSRLSKTEFIQDTELSIVHELIHLTMAKLPLDSENTDLEEEAVKRISAALLGLRPNEKPQLSH